MCMCASVLASLRKLSDCIKKLHCDFCISSLSRHRQLHKLIADPRKERHKSLSSSSDKEQLKASWRVCRAFW